LQRINLVWIDEATELCEAAWDVLIPTIREAGARFLISFNPRYKTDAVYQRFIINHHPDADVFQINYNENPFFPDTLKTEMEYDKSINMAKYLHIWEGGLIDETVGALWKHGDMHYAPAPEVMQKIVVAVDPSGTAKATSDACGIVAAGRQGGRYWVIDDVTRIASPLEWAKAAINIYYKLKANCIVYEDNYGGDMVPTIIHQLDARILCVPAHAARGKMLRAEPVKTLYEQGLVSHVRPFADLEYEMTTYTGEKTQASPNRLDAMVYALTNLSEPEMVAIGKQETRNRPTSAGYRKAEF
jgi:phage terminase large subunit-like protein